MQHRPAFISISVP